MWFEEDDKTVHIEMIHVSRDVDIEIVVRFVSLCIPAGSQMYDGRQGWFCAYIVLRNEDFDRISSKLSYCDSGYPILDVPGDVSYFNKVAPFVEYGMNPDYAVIGWDYNHGIPSEVGVGLPEVIEDAKRTAISFARYFDERSGRTDREMMGKERGRPLRRGRRF